MTSLEMTKKIASILDEKKARDIEAIYVEGVTSIADYFVIASGTSTTQVKSLSDEVEERLSALGIEPKRVEGYLSASWIVLDYYDVIVHIFCGETREFYSLERLWSDGEKLDLSDVLTLD